MFSHVVVTTRAVTFVRRRVRGDASRIVRVVRLACVAALLGTIVPTPAAAAVITGATYRASLGVGGVQGRQLVAPGFYSGVGSWNPRLSDDGRVVAFLSDCPNLVTPDTGSPLRDSYDDAYARNTVTGVILRLTVASNGAQVDQPGAGDLFINDDARVAAFSSWEQYDPTDTNYYTDVIVRDRTNMTTSRASVSSAEALGNDYSSAGGLDSTGRYATFWSSATNLVSGDTNGCDDVFVRDRTGGNTNRVSVGNSGVQANDDSYDCDISDDGRYVAFMSTASNLVTGDTNGKSDVFVRDRLLGRTVRVSISDNEAQSNGFSGMQGLSISGNGRYVAFASDATNLVSGDTNGWMDVFVRDMVAGTTRRVSVNSAEAQSNGNSSGPSITDDGRFVAFDSSARNLVSGDTNGQPDVFLRDTVAGTTRRVSVSTDGGQLRDGAMSPAIAGNGRFVAFETEGAAASFDTNRIGDVYVRDIVGETRRVFDADRFGTSVAIARDRFDPSYNRSWPGVSHVIVASGDDRAAADPLTASGLCGAYNAPLFLVSAKSTPGAVSAAIKEIAAARKATGTAVAIHVVGGKTSVPDARVQDIVRAVGTSGRVTTERLAAGDRYALSVLIARRIAATSGNPSVIMVANGADQTKFFDALALSPISAKRKFPIVLTPAARIPAGTLGMIGAMKPSLVGVAGGTSTVSDAALRQLQAPGRTVQRWAGATRYSTASTIANTAIAKGWLSASSVGIAAKLPDALTGGGVCGLTGGPLLLSAQGALPKETVAWLGAHRTQVGTARVFGGSASLSQTAREQVEQNLR